jgi:hypothetical protein
VDRLREQQAEARRLDAAIEANLQTLGYPISGETPFREIGEHQESPLGALSGPLTQNW